MTDQALLTVTRAEVERSGGPRPNGWTRSFQGCNHPCAGR